MRDQELRPFGGLRLSSPPTLRRNIDSNEEEREDEDFLMNDHREREHQQQGSLLHTGDNLDLFFTKVYVYYTNKGLGCLIASNISTLV
jgi:hypothetical protein